MQKIYELLGKNNKGKLVVISGRPAAGTTALLRQTFVGSGLEEKKVFFDLEDEPNNEIDVWGAAVCLLTNRTIEEYKNPAFRGVFEEVENKLEERLNKTIGLYFTPSWSFEKYLIEIVKQKYAHGLDALYIDGFEELHRNGDASAKMIAKSLKTLAVELDIAVFVTAKHSRRRDRINSYLFSRADKIVSVKRRDHVATADDLISGRIKRGESEIYVEKNLDGEIGKSTLYFHYQRCGFFEDEI